MYRATKVQVLAMLQINATIKATVQARSKVQYRCNNWQTDKYQAEVHVTRCSWT